MAVIYWIYSNLIKERCHEPILQLVPNILWHLIIVNHSFQCLKIVSRSVNILISREVFVRLSFGYPSRVYLLI